MTYEPLFQASVLKPLPSILFPLQPEPSLGQGDLKPLDKKEIGAYGRDHGDQAVESPPFHSQDSQEGHHQKKGDQGIPESVEKEGGHDHRPQKEHQRLGRTRHWCALFFLLHFF